MMKFSTLIFLFILASCATDKTEPVFEGFRLGERLDMQQIIKKFGEHNTLNRHTEILKSLNIDPRISLGQYGNNTWDYKFTNGLTSFVTFVDTDSILTQIVIQIGSIEQLFPSRPGYSDLYGIKERIDPGGLDYLKTTLKKKYGQPTDSLSIIMEPDLKKIIWEFNKYQVHLLYRDSYDECKIRYILDWDKVDKIEERKKKNDVDKQADKL